MNENRSNLQKKWSILKEIINSKGHSSYPDSRTIDGNTVTDKAVIADNFNKFFVNVGPTLAKSIPTTVYSPTRFLKERNLNTIFLIPVLDQEVEKMKKKIKIS